MTINNLNFEYFKRQTDKLSQLGPPYRSLNESVNLGPFINEPIIDIQLARGTFIPFYFNELFIVLMPFELKIAHISSRDLN